MGYIIYAVSKIILINIWPTIEQLIDDISHAIGIGVPKEITAQIERAGDKADERGRNNKTNKHHIVAKAAVGATGSRYILYKCGIGINEDCNIAVVNETVHWYIHTTIYHKAVYDYLSKSYDTAVSDKRTTVVAALYLLKVKLEMA